MSWLSGLFGSNNTFQSNVQAPDATLYQQPGQQALNTQLAGQLANSQGATPMAQAAQVNNAAFGQTQAGTQALASQLANTASGGGQSPADLQLQQGLQAQLAQQRAATVSQAGNINPYLAQRQIAQQTAQAQQATNAQAGIQRAGETQQAQQALGNVYGQLGNQQINVAQNQAGLQQQVSLANQQAAQQQQQINNQNAQYYTGQQINQANTQLGANEALSGQQQAASIANNSINAGVAAGNQSTGAAILGGLFGAGGAAAGKMSDERLKHKIKRDTDKEMDDFLKKLDPARFEYKDEAFGVGEHYGIMAQSAQKSRVGKSFVDETPEGLGLNTHKGLNVVLAALKHLDSKHERLAQSMTKKKA